MQSPLRSKSYGALAKLFDRFTSKSAAKSLGIKEDDMLTEISQSILADTVDAFFGRLAPKASRRLRVREGTESDRDLDQLHQAGRLYWFGRSDIPILQTYAKKTTAGHYFIDLKDFTARTALLKEEVRRRPRPGPTCLLRPHDQCLTLTASVRRWMLLLPPPPRTAPGWGHLAGLCQQARPAWSAYC